jgi:hypothetical protein
VVEGVLLRGMQPSGLWQETCNRADWAHSLFWCQSGFAPPVACQPDHCTYSPAWHWQHLATMHRIVCADTASYSSEPQQHLQTARICCSALSVTELSCWQQTRVPNCIATHHAVHNQAFQHSQPTCQIRAALLNPTLTLHLQQPPQLTSSSAQVT